MFRPLPRRTCCPLGLMSPKEPPSSKGIPHPRQGVRSLPENLAGGWESAFPSLGLSSFTFRTGNGLPSLAGGSEEAALQAPKTLRMVGATFISEMPLGSPLRGLSLSSRPAWDRRPPKSSLSLARGLLMAISQCLGSIGEFGGPLPAPSSQSPSDSGHCPPTIPHSLHHAACSTVSR